MIIGLKGSMKHILENGGNSRFKTKEIKRTLKYGLQRLTNGYDEREVYDFCLMFVERNIAILESIKKNGKIILWCPDGYDWSKVCEPLPHSDIYKFSKEQTDVILDMIIYHLKMSTEEYVYKKLYGDSYENLLDDYIFNNKDECISIYEKIENIRKQNQDAAMDLLKIFLDQLWY